MKKVKLSIISLLSIVTLVSCSNTPLSSNSNSKSNQDTTSNDTSSNNSSSTKKEESSIKGRKAQLDISVDAGLFGSLLDIAMPFDILYKEDNQKVGSYDNLDVQIKVADALKVADYIYEKDNGNTNKSTILKGFTTLLSFPGQITTLANKISEDKASISFLDYSYYDDMLSNAELLKGLKSGDNNKATININYQDGKNLTYFINTEEDGVKKLRNYAYTDKLVASSFLSIKQAKNFIESYVDNLATNEKVNNGGMNIDFSIFETLYNAMAIKDDNLAQLFSFLSTGLQGTITGKDNTDNSHDTTINIGINKDGLTQINNQLNSYINSSDLTFKLTNADINIIFNKVSGSHSKLTHFDFDANMNVSDLFNIDLSLNFYLDPTVYSYESNALDSMDEETLIANEGYQRYSVIDNEVSEFYDFGYTFQNMDKSEQLAYLGKNISLNDEYSTKITEACTDLENLDSYAKGLIKDGITGVKPTISLVSSFDSNYIGFLYEYGKEYLSLSKENLSRVNFNNLTLSKIPNVIGSDVIKYFRPLYWDILSKYNDWTLLFTNDELEIMKNILDKNTNLFETSVNEISSLLTSLDTLENINLSHFTSLIELIDEKIPSSCLDYDYYFDGESKTNFDTKIENGKSVMQLLFDKIESYAGNISTYSDLEDFLEFLNSESFNIVSRLGYDFEGELSQNEKSQIISDNQNNYIELFENEVNSQYSSFETQSSNLTSQDEAKSLIVSINNEVDSLTTIYSYLTSEKSLPSKYSDQFDNLINTITSNWNI